MRSAQQASKAPWNQDRIVGPKPPLKPQHIWAVRTRLQQDGRTRDLAVFNPASPVSCEAETLSGSASATFISANRSGFAQPSSSRKPVGRSRLS
jgi:hypothetical protein